MTTENEPVCDPMRKFEISRETRNFEINLLWKRSVFFWGFIAAAFISYGTLSKGHVQDNVILLLISSFGFICSLAWTVANRGGKFWQQVWEERVEAEEKVLGIRIFAEPARTSQVHFWGSPWHRWHHSVTRVITSLSDFTVLIWIVLAARLLLSQRVASCSDCVVEAVIVTLTLAYAVAMLLGTASKGPHGTPGA